MDTARTSPIKGKRKGFWENIHVCGGQRVLTEEWFAFNGADDMYCEPKCNHCNKELEVGDYIDGFHPYHQEYNSCQEHKDEFANSLSSSTST